MTKSVYENEVIPSARRLIKSLRDMGYDFAAAVADLVDNSIEAGATLIAIDVEFDGDDSWVRIADDGTGMTSSQLREAMRYGSKRDYNANDLGKFGLGLKTASLSQCQKLTVATRPKSRSSTVTTYCWDLNHIEATNRWEIIPFNLDDLAPALREPLKETANTVVLWERLDRMLGYRLPYGESARKKLTTMCRDAEKHLAMVLHRFLQGEIPKKKIMLTLNGNAITPWDPFARNESKTKVLTPVVIKLEHEGVAGEIHLQPYVLPHQNDFSSPDAFKQASGPANWNQQQGFYIYRAGRLIQSGGWCRLRTVDEHTKLARIALSFSPDLDEAFKINVAKMRVQLPSQIREQIEQAIKPLVKIARDVYDRPSTRHPIKTVSKPSAEPTTLITSPTAGPRQVDEAKPFTISSSSSDTQRLWTIDELHSRLKNVAEPEERPIIAKVFKRLLTHLKSKGDS